MWTCRWSTSGLKPSDSGRCQQAGSVSSCGSLHSSAAGTDNKTAAMSSSPMYAAARPSSCNQQSRVPQHSTACDGTTWSAHNAMSTLCAARHSTMVWLLAAHHSSNPRAITAHTTQQATDPHRSAHAHHAQSQGACLQVSCVVQTAIHAGLSLLCFKKHALETKP